MFINVNTDPLEPAGDFPYLGHTVAYNNSYWVAMYQNLSKAHRQWGMVANVAMNTG